MFWTILFLALIVAYTATRLYLTLRHSRHIATHREVVPAAFAEQITLEQHQKAADYTQAKIKFGWPFASA